MGRPWIIIISPGDWRDSTLAAQNCQNANPSSSSWVWSLRRPLLPLLPRGSRRFRVRFGQTTEGGPWHEWHWAGPAGPLGSWTEGRDGPGTRADFQQRRGPTGGPCGAACPAARRCRGSLTVSMGVRHAWHEAEKKRLRQQRATAATDSCDSLPLPL